VLQGRVDYFPAFEQLTLSFRTFRAVTAKALGVCALLSLPLAVPLIWGNAALWTKAKLWLAGWCDLDYFKNRWSVNTGRFLVFQQKIEEVAAILNILIDIRVTTMPIPHTMAWLDQWSPCSKEVWRRLVPRDRMGRAISSLQETASTTYSRYVKNTPLVGRPALSCRPVSLWPEYNLFRRGWTTKSALPA